MTARSRRRRASWRSVAFLDWRSSPRRLADRRSIPAPGRAGRRPAARSPSRGGHGPRTVAAVHRHADRGAAWNGSPSRSISEAKADVLGRPRLGDRLDPRAEPPPMRRIPTAAPGTVGDRLASCPMLGRCHRDGPRAASRRRWGAASDDRRRRGRRRSSCGRPSSPVVTATMARGGVGSPPGGQLTRLYDGTCS